MEFLVSSHCFLNRCLGTEGNGFQGPLLQRLQPLRLSKQVMKDVPGIKNSTCFCLGSQATWVQAAQLRVAMAQLPPLCAPRRRTLLCAGARAPADPLAKRWSPEATPPGRGPTLAHWLLLSKGNCDPAPAASQHTVSYSLAGVTSLPPACTATGLAPDLLGARRCSSGPKGVNEEACTHCPVGQTIAQTFLTTRVPVPLSTRVRARAPDPSAKQAGAGGSLASLWRP